jgi:hypothetical protein
VEGTDVRKLVVGLLVIVVGSLLTVNVGEASPPFVLFGDALEVKAGTGGNPWAVELSSRCLPSYPSCFGAEGTFTFSGIAFRHVQDIPTFADLFWLSIDFNPTDDACGGGSPRFSIGIDTTGDGVRDGAIFVYVGTIPNFDTCGSGWQSTGNLVGLADTEIRFDLTQLGGAFYGTYGQALALVGGAGVTGISFVVDGGWLPADGEQTILADNFRVNGFQLTARGAR